MRYGMAIVTEGVAVLRSEFFDYLKVESGLLSDL